MILASARREPNGLRRLWPLAIATLISGCFLQHTEEEPPLQACESEMVEGFGNFDSRTTIMENGDAFVTGLMVTWPADDPEFMAYNGNSWPRDINCSAPSGAGLDEGGCGSLMRPETPFAGTGFLLLRQLEREAPYIDFVLPCAAKRVYFSSHAIAYFPGIEVVGTALDARGGEIERRSTGGPPLVSNFLANRIELTAPDARIRTVRVSVVGTGPGTHYLDEFGWY